MHRTEVATLGGGCFWCLEAAFSQLRGVEKVESGYSGGSISDPSYEEVCSGNTGHAEVVQITFDPGIISFKDILGVFFSLHDPTTLNRQGHDTGTQYRSVIFYHSSQQKDTAIEAINRLGSEKFWNMPIVTEVAQFQAFYAAEDYHRDYFEHHPEQMYCRFEIAPKIAKIRRLFFSRLKRNS
jgi:peptide-methionine (S)-S-oxide reductase